MSRSPDIDGSELAALAVFDPWGPPPGVPATPPPTPAQLARSEFLPILASLLPPLRRSGHRATIQDLLDVPERPALRFLVWPHPGLMEKLDRAGRATLEWELGEGDPPEVRITAWWGDARSERIHLGRLPAEAVGPAWVRERFLDGLRRILAGS